MKAGWLLHGGIKTGAGFWSLVAAIVALSHPLHAMGQTQTSAKPVLHGRNWIAITGKPLGASAGAMIFQEGGNAVDAACAMLGATATMFDEHSWGGETQALIYNPGTGDVRGINALGVAPTGATPEFFRERHRQKEGADVEQTEREENEKRGALYPPGQGALAAVTPGTPGGLMVMLAEFGTMSLEEVLGPSIQMADGYPIERETADSIEKKKKQIAKWPYSKELFLPHFGEEGREGPYPGEIFAQADLAATLRKLVETERAALTAGKSRKDAIYAAYDRFYKGDIAEEFVRGSREQGGLHTVEDLAGWKVYIEEPVMTTYKDVEVYKLTTWVQGPVLLQALSILENADLRSMGFNSATYIHALYQAMNLAYADRDFYYGDPYFPPEEPVRGLLSKAYGKKRFDEIDWKRNDPKVPAGDPYPFQGGKNPYLDLIEKWHDAPGKTAASKETVSAEGLTFEEGFLAGTTSVLAADKEGWVVSMTPSGGWIPATIAGRTGIGMSQRMQSFVLDESENPFNVVEPGKRPRATLTPSLALKEGKPYLAFAVQGGDTQDQNLLQFFLNMVEFDMNVQEAAEAPNITSYQMRSSFGAHESKPGRLMLNESVLPFVRRQLGEMGYELEYDRLTSGPINAIYFDREHATMWGGSSNFGEDYGIAW